LGGGVWEIAIPGKKLARLPISVSKISMLVVPVIPAMWEAVGRRIMV
jgi:hypothetical protein